MKLIPVPFPSFCGIFYCRKRSPKTKDEPFVFVAPQHPQVSDESKVATTENVPGVKAGSDIVDAVKSQSVTEAQIIETTAVVKETDNKIPKVELPNQILVQSGQQPLPPPPPITIVNKDDFQFAEPQTVRSVR